MANRIEITITAKQDASLREIGKRVEREVGAGAKGAGDKLDREISDGARKAGAHAEQELGKAGADAGGSFSHNFAAKSQLRDTRDRFQRVGAEMGQAAADGAGRALKTGFTRAGSEAGSSAGVATGRSFGSRVAGMFGSLGRRVGRTFGISFGSSAGNAGQKAGKSLISTLSDVLSGGIKQPMILGPLLVAAAAAAPVAGAALATGLVLAFGAGLAGIGLVAASRLKSVQREMKSFGSFASSWAKNNLGRPMKGAFDSMLSSARHVMEALGPTLKSAFKVNISPAMSRFFDNLGDALVKLKPAIKPLSKAFADLMDAIGPRLPGIVKDISDAIISISNTISKNPDLFGNIITGLLELIPLALQLVGVLASAYAAVSRFTGTKSMWRNLIDVLSPINGIIDHFGGLKKILDSISNFFSGKGNTKASATISVKDNASKVINKVKSLASAFARTVWRGVLTVQNLATKGVNAAKRLAASFAKATYRATMRAVNKAGSAINAAKKLAQNYARATYRAVMLAVNRAGSAINAARSAANRFAHATYRAVLTARNAVWSAVNSALAAARNWAGRVFTATLNVVKNFSPFEHGGVVGAKATGGISKAATGGARGSSVLVGEHGPEIVNLPGGSRVRSNPDTRRLLGQAGGGAGPIVIQLRIGDRALGDLLIDPIRKTVRSRGGNVQAVLGSG